MKDGEDGAKFAFKLVPVEIGVDADGEPVTSCIVESASLASVGNKKEPKPGSIERTLLDAIRDDPSIDGRVSIAAIVEAVAKKLPKPEDRDTRKQHLARALRALASKGFIAVEGEQCRIL
jgi:hypothetical protein